MSQRMNWDKVRRDRAGSKVDAGTLGSHIRTTPRTCGYCGKPFTKGVKVIERSRDDHRHAYCNHSK